MTDLPTRYAALVERRPELAVDGLAWFVGTPAAWTDADGRMDPDACPAMWTIHENGPFMYAETLILARLVEALPRGVGVARNFALTPAYCVVTDTGDEVEWDYAYPTPLDALFAFWESLQ